MNRHLQSLRVVAIFTLTLAHLGSSMGCKSRIPTSSPARSSVASAPEDARSAHLREAKQSLAAARAANASPRRVEIPTTPEVKATTGVARYILVIKAHRHVSLVGLDDSGRLVKGFKARLRKVDGDDVIELRSGSERLITTAKRGLVMSTLSPESVAHLSAVSGQIAHTDVGYDTCSDDTLLLGAVLTSLAADAAACFVAKNPYACLKIAPDVIAAHFAHQRGEHDGCWRDPEICLPDPNGNKLCENFDCSTDSECQARFDPLGYDAVWGCSITQADDSGAMYGSCDFRKGSDICTALGGVYNADDELCQPPPCADDYEYDSGTGTCKLTNRAECAVQGLTLDNFDTCALCPPGSSFDQATLGCVESQECDPSTDPSCAGDVCIDEPLLCEPDECFYDGTDWCDASNGY